MEATIALAATRVARSPALLGFGGNSAMELLSAITVLWRFRSKSEVAQAERIATPVAGALLFVVAASVVAASALALAGYRKPQPSLVGIIILIAAALGNAVNSNGKSVVVRVLSPACYGPWRLGR